MALTIQPIDINDLLDEGRIKINDNFYALKDAVDTLSGVTQANQFSEEVYQPGHSFAVGDVLKGVTGGYAKASALTEEDAAVVGIVSALGRVDNPNDQPGRYFILTYSGRINGLSGLSPGDIHYLQDDGTLGTTPGTNTRPVIVATDYDEGVFLHASSGGLGADTEIGDLDNVDTTGATTGDAFVYDGALWKAQALNLTDLGDVRTTPPPVNGNALIYDGLASQWRPQSIPGGGDMLRAVYDPANLGHVARASVADAVQWNNVSNRPLEFPPAYHEHTIVQVDGLSLALSGKANTNHSHAASDITSGTFPAARLATDSVTTIKVQNAAITTPKLADGAVTVDKHTMADTSNIVKNPMFEENGALSVAGWTGDFTASNILNVGNPPARFGAQIAAGPSSKTIINGRPFNVREGDTYFVSLWVLRGSPSAPPFTAGLRFTDRDGNNPIDSAAVTIPGSGGTHAWFFVSGQVTVPANRTLAEVYLTTAGGGTGYWAITSATVKQAVSQDLLADGAVTPSKLAPSAQPTSFMPQMTGATKIYWGRTHIAGPLSGLSQVTPPVVSVFRGHGGSTGELEIALNSAATPTPLLMVTPMTQASADYRVTWLVPGEVSMHPSNVTAHGSYLVRAHGYTAAPDMISYMLIYNP